MFNQYCEALSTRLLRCNKTALIKTVTPIKRRILFLWFIVSKSINKCPLLRRERPVLRNRPENGRIRCFIIVTRLNRGRDDVLVFRCTAHLAPPMPDNKRYHYPEQRRTHKNRQPCFTFELRVAVRFLVFRRHY